MSNRSYSSKTVRCGTRLLAASTAIAAPLMLAGCDNDGGASAIYENQERCVAGKVFAPEYCAEKFKEAEHEHTQLAPHYEDKADCEKDWGEGSCEVKEAADSDQQQQQSSRAHGGGTVIVRSGGGYYSPRMGGAWVGYTSDSSGEKGTPPVRRNFSYPVYGDATKGYVSPLTEQTFDEAGRVYTRPNASVAGEIRSMPRAVLNRGVTMARPSTVGGFGLTGRGFGFAAGS